jgi:hypothetical protein
MRYEIKMILDLEDIQLLDNSIGKGHKFTVYLLPQPRTTGDSHIELHPIDIDIRMIDRKR